MQGTMMSEWRWTRNPPQFVRHLFGNDEGMEEVGSGTAVFLAHTGAEETLRAELFSDLLGDKSILFPCVYIERNLIGKISTYRFTEDLVLSGIVLIKL